MIPNTSTTTTNASSSSQENEDKSRSIFITIYDDDEDENKQMQLRKQRPVIKYLFCGFLLLFVFIAGFNLFTNANTKSNLMNIENQNEERNLLCGGECGGYGSTCSCGKAGEEPMDLTKEFECNECGVTINLHDVKKYESVEPIICAVCFDNIVRGEVICQLACKHQFHKGCVGPWLIKNGICPTCRDSISFPKLCTCHQIPDDESFESQPSVDMGEMDAAMDGEDVREHTGQITDETSRCRERTRGAGSVMICTGFFSAMVGLTSPWLETAKHHLDPGCVCWILVSILIMVVGCWMAGLRSRRHE